MQFLYFCGTLQVLGGKGGGGIILFSSTDHVSQVPRLVGLMPELAVFASNGVINLPAG